MKIVIIGKNAFSFREKESVIKPILTGHTMALTAQLIPFLVDKGHKVCFLCPAQKGRNDIWAPFEVKPPSRVHIRTFAHTRYPKVPTSINIDCFLEEFGACVNQLGGVDWVLTIYGFPFSILVEVARIACSFRHLVALRGGDAYKFLHLERLSASYSCNPGQLYLIDVYRESLKRADLVLAASEWLARQIQETGVKVDDIFPSPALSVADSERRDRFGLAELATANAIHNKVDPNCKWLIAAGRLSNDKRLDILFRAFAKWRRVDWQLVILGDGLDAPTLISLASEIGISERICITTLPPLQLADFMSNSHALIHTSIGSSSFEDARPSAVTTAAFYGLPVILPTNTGGATESVSKENSNAFGFVVASDDNDTIMRVVRCLERLVDDQARKVIGKANSAFAEKFAPHIVFAKLEKLLTDQTKQI